MTSYAIPLPRISAAMVSGALVTAALLWLMQDLIRHDGAVPDLVPVLRIVDIVRIPDPVDRPTEELPKLIEVVQPPPTRIEPTFDPFGRGSEIFDPPALDESFDGPVGTGLPDGEMLPIVKVAPAYPQRAVTRGLEGFVLLEFDVDEAGRVVSPRVIESEPRGVFDQAALRAVLKFKYKPRVFNGVPVRVEGVLHRLTFELNDI